MEQLILHLVGDYLLQSDWMAQEKRRSHVAALAHALAYSLPFLLWPLLIPPGTLLPEGRVRVDADGMARAAWLTWQAFGFILGTHFLIDRFGLARYVVWAKNFLAPRRRSENWPGRRRNHLWADCVSTGYFVKRTEWMAVWLTIIADNTLHLICNYVALRWL